MARRTNERAPYYLEHNIITGQYTSGDEFVYASNFEDYVGLYHILPGDRAWTESAPRPGQSRELLKKPKHFNDDVKTYLRNNGFKEVKYIAPVPAPYLPRQADYDRGYIYRHFIQKRSNPLNTIMEIDSEQFTRMNNRNLKGINSVIWRGQIIKWYIKGKLQAYFNEREVTEAKKDFPGIDRYLHNYLEYRK